MKLREEKMILLLFSFNLSKVTNDTEAARFLTFIFNFTFGNPQIIYTDLLDFLIFTFNVIKDVFIFFIGNRVIHGPLIEDCILI